jgi:hypothetical protein
MSFERPVCGIHLPLHIQAHLSNDRSRHEQLAGLQNPHDSTQGAHGYIPCAKEARRGRRWRARAAALNPSSPSFTPGCADLQVPSSAGPLEDANGILYWKDPYGPTGKGKARWEGDGYLSGDEAIPCSMELVLQFFEQDSVLWAKFRAGASGKTGLSIADDIRTFMKARRAQFARPADTIKSHIDYFFINTFEPALAIADDTGAGDDQDVQWKGKTVHLYELLRE